MKEDFITHSSLEEGACHTMQGHMGKHQVWPGGRRSEGKAGPRALTAFSMGRKVGRKLQVKQLSRLRIG